MIKMKIHLDMEDIEKLNIYKDYNILLVQESETVWQSMIKSNATFYGGSINRPQKGLPWHDNEGNQHNVIEWGLEIWRKGMWQHFYNRINKINFTDMLKRLVTDKQRVINSLQSQVYGSYDDFFQGENSPDRALQKGFDRKGYDTGQLAKSFKIEITHKGK